jgi:hypothetical protein
MTTCFRIWAVESTSLSMFGSLVVGIVSSLVATFIFLVLAEVARRILVPWFRQQVYRGVRVDGLWRWEIAATADTSKHDLQFQFVQAGDQLSGVHTLVSSDADGRVTVSTYSIVGFVADARVIGYVRPLDKQSTTYTSFYLVFRDTVHGAELFGHLTSEKITGELISPEVRLERVRT